MRAQSAHTSHLFYSLFHTTVTCCASSIGYGSIHTARIVARDTRSGTPPLIPCSNSYGVGDKSEPTYGGVHETLTGRRQEDEPPVDDNTNAGCSGLDKTGYCITHTTCSYLASPADFETTSAGIAGEGTSSSASDEKLSNRTARNRFSRMKRPMMSRAMKYRDAQLFVTCNVSYMTMFHASPVKTCNNREEG